MYNKVPALVNKPEERNVMRHPGIVHSTIISRYINLQMLTCGGGTLL